VGAKGIQEEDKGRREACGWGSKEKKTERNLSRVRYRKKHARTVNCQSRGKYGSAATIREGGGIRKPTVGWVLDVSKVRRIANEMDSA